MPQIRRILDLNQGYDFKRDMHTAVGFVTSMKLGDTDLYADQTCTIPTTPGAEVRVVAVLGDIAWDMGATDAIYLSGQVSPATQQQIARLAIGSQRHVEVTFRFGVYEYDPRAKKYFPFFHNNTADMKGLVEKREGEFTLFVADASTEVQSPQHYAFRIGVKPQLLAQSLHVATSAEKTVVKSWGLAIP